MYEGDASILKGRAYDVIIANINRNILLNDIGVYAQCLNSNGELYLSGFYTEDVPQINEAAEKNGLVLSVKYEKNNWVGLKFVN